MSDFDPDEALERSRSFRHVLSRFCAGITVVTATVDGVPAGLTCQSFSSVSLEPPLVLFCASSTSRAWPRIRQAGSFCVNLLAHDQTAISDRMSSASVDKFAGVAWQPSVTTGSPVLDGVLGYIDCRIEAIHPAGDHDVVVGRVQHLAAYDDATPLLRFEGAYRFLAD